MLSISVNAKSNPELLLELSASNDDFIFEEFKNGQRINRESGSLPGMRINAKYKHGRFFSSVNGNHAKADISHNGQTQAGNDFVSRTDQTIQHFSVDLGWQVFNRENYAVSLLSSVGVREWERDIRSSGRTLGIKETYQWDYFSAGITAEHNYQNHILHLRLSRHFVFNSDEDVVFKNDFDPVQLSPEFDSAYKVGIGWRMNLDTRWAIGAELNYQKWKFDPSNPKPLARNSFVVGELLQPANETKIQNMVFSLMYRLR